MTARSADSDVARTTKERAANRRGCEETFRDSVAEISLSFDFPLARSLAMKTVSTVLSGIFGAVVLIACSSGGALPGTDGGKEGGGGEAGGTRGTGGTHGSGGTKG